MNKITKKDIYTALVNFAETGEITIPQETLKAFAENELALIDKKNAKARERSAKKKAEADELLSMVEAALTDEYQSISEVVGQVVAVGVEDVTASKIAYRLNALVKDGIAEKTDIKVSGEDGKKRTVKGFRRISVEE